MNFLHTQDAYERTNKGFAIGVLTPIILTTGIILYIWIQVIKLLLFPHIKLILEPWSCLLWWGSQPFNFPSQVEKGSLFERGVTLLLVFLQLYPQYRALRIIFMRSLYSISQSCFFYMLIAKRRKFIDSLTVELEEEIYSTKISYIEPIFEGGLQVIPIFFICTLSFLFSFILFPRLPSSCTWYIWWTQRWTNHPVKSVLQFFVQDRGVLHFRNLAYDEGDTWWLDMIKI